MRRILASGALAGALLVSVAGGALAGQPVKTTIWLDGVQVRTILPPAATPQEGRDPFYMVPDADGVVAGVASVGPGSAGYHGGQWQVFLVSWDVDVTPYPLTSVSAILAAEDVGDITIARAAELDFLCPIQP